MSELENKDPEAFDTDGVSLNAAISMIDETVAASNQGAIILFPEMAVELALVFGMLTGIQIAEFSPDGLEVGWKARLLGTATMLAGFLSANRLHLGPKGDSCIRYLLDHRKDTDAYMVEHEIPDWLTLEQEKEQQSNIITLDSLVKSTRNGGRLH